MKHKLLKSALLGAAAVGMIASSANAAEAKMYFDLYYDGSVEHITDGSNPSNMLTIPCEATDYLAGKDYDLDNDVASYMGNYTGVTIKYKTNYGNLTEGDQIRFKLHNAVFGSLQKCWLVFYEKNGVDTNDDGVGDTDHDANGDGDSLDSLIIAESVGPIAGQSEIFLRVTNNGTSYPANGILYLACADTIHGEAALSDEDKGSTPAQYDTAYNPIIRLADLYNQNEHYNVCENPVPQEKVCMTVKANACCPNTDLELPDLSIATPQCFIDSKCEFSLSMRPTLSIINMIPQLGNVTCDNSISGIIKCYDPAYEPGTQFVDTAGDILTSTSCTDNDAADGTITIVDNDNNIEDHIVLGSAGWNAKFHVSLYDTNNRYACDNDTAYGSLQPYAALDFANNRMYIDNNGDDTSTTGVNIRLNPGAQCTTDAIDVEEGSGCTPSSYRICLPSSGVWTDDVYMGITGHDRLYWVKWGLTEQLDIMTPDNDVIFTVKMDENAQCVKFECCYDNEGNAPYFKKWEPNGQEAYIPHLLNNGLTYVKVANNSCWDAEIYARVWDEDGDFVDNVYLGVAPAHGAAILWGKDIFAKAKALNPAIGGGYGTFSAIITVGAPKRDVEIAAGDSRDGKGKMLPVYDLDGEFLYYRNVDFDHDAFNN